MFGLMIITYFVLGWLLYELNNYVLKKSCDKRLYLIISAVILVLLSGFFTGIGLSEFSVSVWGVALSEALFRFIIYKLDNRENEWVVSYQRLSFLNVILAFLINALFINQVDSVWPSNESLKTIFWLFTLYVGYHYLSGLVNNKKVKDKKQFNFSSEYIVTKYAFFKQKYFNIMEIKDKKIRKFIYAYMIFENNLCNEYKRKIDNWLLKLNDKPRRVGLMQIKSDKPLSDEESIKVVVNKIKKMNDTKLTINLGILDDYQNNKEILEKIVDVIDKFDKM